VDSAIRYLAGIKHRKAAPLLRDILDAEEERFSAAAARALGYCGDAEDALYLVQYRRDRDTPDAVAGEIIFAWGNSGTTLLRNTSPSCFRIPTPSRLGKSPSSMPWEDRIEIGARYAAGSPARPGRERAGRSAFGRRGIFRRRRGEGRC
jgi:hypothetical protein